MGEAQPRTLVEKLVRLVSGCSPMSRGALLLDVLELDGTDVAPLPYLERRALLDASAISTGVVQVTLYWPDSSAEPMLELANEHRP